MESRPKPDANSDISNLLWMLRSENATQYFTLVKMHLSFTTDLSTDECDGKLDNTKGNSSKWNLTPLKRRFKNNSNLNTPKYVMDGVPLTQEGVCHAYQLINFLGKEENIKQEGIFRKAGSCSRQQELKNSLNCGTSLNLECAPYSAHDCASVLKNFLAELPEPLLQEDNYHVHCRIAEMCSHEINSNSDSQSYKRRVKALQLVFLLLPFANYQLLKDLLLLLHNVALFEKHNKMSASNLGTMFAPQILCPRKMTPNDMQALSKVLSTAVAFMIENADKLFQIPFELEVDVRHYWTNINKTATDETDGAATEAATAASFTFIDKDLTAKANDDDVTKVALADLYACVQSLPESARKRKLVKQFNEASGRGTPIKGRPEYKEPRMRSIGDSIKKHLLHKSIRNKKNKPQDISCKRSNSDEYLNDPTCCSPELKLFRRMSPKRVSKSMEELSPPRSKISPPYDILKPHSMCETPTRKGCLADSSREFISTPELGFYGTVSLSDQSLDASSCCLTEVRTPCSEARQQFDATGNACVFSPSEDSPISRAVLKSNVQQRVIMTPRSRCPIIINSSTSLASVYMNDLPKRENLCDKDAPQLVEGGKENFQNVPNDCDESKNEIKSSLSGHNSTSSGFSTYKSVSSSTSSYNSFSPNSSIDDKSIVSSGSSLFGGFFDKLSTSSLMKLTSRLSGSSIRQSSKLSPCPESVRSEGSDVEDANDSLSSVFKDYLINRSSVSINDTKVQLNVEETLVSNAQPHFSPPQETSLSDSLLFCLNGNSPSDNSDSMGSITEVQSPSSCQRAREDLHSCSPNGRSKLFRNKHGTPIPNRDQQDPALLSDSKSVIFETSF